MQSAKEITKPKHVIFRSKGCKTCRTRKVKCDEARPICQRCIRSRFDCQGYSEPTSFLCDNPRVKNTSSASLAASIRPFQAQPVSDVPRPLPYPVELTHTAFLVRRLSIGTLGDRSGFSWLKLGLESPARNSLFHITTRCLAEVYYGRVLRHEGIVTNGMAKYGGILRDLRQQLLDPELFHVNNLMSVIMAAVVIESVANQTAAGLHAHVRGLSQLVRRAGPEAFMSLPNIFIFEMCRCWIIGRAIIGKYETFVADPEWKQIPWTYEKKQMIAKLWDIISDLPSLAIGVRCLPESTRGVILEGPIRPQNPLYLRFISITQDLFNWRWDWERQYSGCAEEVPVFASDLVTDEKGDPWYPSLIQFSSRERAMEIIYYDATLIYLFRIARQLQWDFVESTGGAPPPEIALPLLASPLLFPSDIHALEDVSSEFYRLIEGCLSAAGKVVGNLYQLMFALSLVNNGLDEDSLEATWMRRIRSRIVATSGLDLWSAARRSI